MIKDLRMKKIASLLVVGTFILFIGLALPGWATDDNYGAAEPRS
jgi:hypothetical protein